MEIHCQCKIVLHNYPIKNHQFTMLRKWDEIE
jgi:hypothetical protein